MKTKKIIILPLLFLFSILNSQNMFVGTFSGTYGGDNITLVLNKTTGNNLTGTMVDSQQKYEVTATTEGVNIKGKAVEKTLDLTFVLNGTLSGNRLDMVMQLNYLGQTQNLDVVFYKQNTGNVAQTSTSKPQNTGKRPAGVKSTIDQNIIGKWVNEQNYSSGVGANYVGGSSLSTIIFNADGTMTDGGSRSVVSGSNFLGDSGSSQQQEIANVWFYTENNQIYLVALENGKAQTVHLGRYYIEGNNMLITGQNGKKMLLRRG